MILKNDISLEQVQDFAPGCIGDHSIHLVDVV